MAALGAAQPEEGASRNGNGGTPLHVLCRSKALTDAAVAVAADRAPPEVWSVQHMQGATPLHMLFCNDRLTAAMVKVAAAKAPPEAWLAQTHQALFSRTPAHRLCVNVARIDLDMLKIAAKHAPPAVWAVKDTTGATPLERLMLVNKSAVRAWLCPWIAEMMTATPPTKPRARGGAGGKGKGAASGAVKLAAAKQFFAMGVAGACALDTGVPLPIQRLDDTRIQVRREVQRQQKGASIELRHKQTVFAEVKYLISTELDRLPEAKDLPQAKDPSERYFKSATGTKEAKQKGAAQLMSKTRPTTCWLVEN